MFKLFSNLIPKNSCHRYGLEDGFSKMFEKKFPQYDPNVLNLIAKSFIVVRIKMVNQNNYSQKSVRAQKKTAEYVANSAK